MENRNIQQFLENLGLTQYFSLFQENDIDLETLLLLEEQDLVQMGINSLGHRKKILANRDTSKNNTEIKGAIPDKNISKDLEEVVLYQSDIDLVDSNSTNIKITNNKAIIENKTFVLKNISAVSVFSDEETIAKQSKVQRYMKTAEKIANKGLYGFALLNAIMIIPALFLDDLNVFICILGALLGWGLARLNVNLPELQLTYYLQIESAGTQSDVIFTKDKEKIEEIMQALNTAIENM